MRAWCHAGWCGGLTAPEEERKRFFFEKKNQKTLSPWHALPARDAPIHKSFLLLFVKKEGLSFPLGVCH
jgi:hypothetical protein